MSIINRFGQVIISDDEIIVEGFDFEARDGDFVTYPNAQRAALEEARRKIDKALLSIDADRRSA